jgi:leader peptidase (prepilin peptidase)/N-methyltransferase
LAPLYAAAFLFGAVIGSFLNVVIYRLPAGQSIVRPRSRCPVCETPIAARDNIPLLSYLLLGGRCRSCRAPIPWRYPLVEGLSGLLCVALLATFGLTPTFFAYYAFAAALLVVTFIDIDHQIIPDEISLPGIPIGVALSFFIHPGWPGFGPQSALIGALAGGGLLYAVAEGYRRLRGIEGMGLGDVKLLAMMGAFLGWRALPLVLLVGSVTGALVGLGLMLAQGKARDLKLAVPFGPFLVLGAYCYLFFGEDLIAWYLGQGRFF